MSRQRDYCQKSVVYSLLYFFAKNVVKCNYCIKGKEKYYLRRLAKSIIADKEKQIRELTKEKNKLIVAFKDLVQE